MALYFALAMRGVRDKSGTADEFIHVAGGYSYWTLNDYRLHPENGNWPQRIVSLPAVLGGERFPSLDQEEWRLSKVSLLGDQFFFGPGADADAMLARARRMVAMASVVLALLVFAWSSRIFGPAGGWITLLVFIFNPTMLAHSALATSDMIATFFFLAATWALWIALHRVTPRTVGVSILAIGGLFVSKFSAVVFIPVALSMVAVRVLSSRPLHLPAGREPVTGGRRIPWFGGLTLVHAVGVVVIIWASFGFRYSAFQAGVTGSERFIDPWAEVVDGSLVGRSVQWGRDNRVLPEAYLYGLATVQAYSQYRSAFLNGEVSQSGGWRRFFPYAALVKSTLPELLLIAMFGVLVIRRLMERGEGEGFDLYELLPLVLLVAWYWAFAISSRLNIGQRHLLPPTAAMTILLGAVAEPVVHAARALRIGRGRAPSTA